MLCVNLESFFCWCSPSNLWQTLETETVVQLKLRHVVFQVSIRAVALVSHPQLPFYCQDDLFFCLLLGEGHGPGNVFDHCYSRHRVHQADWVRATRRFGTLSWSMYGFL